MNTKNTLSAHRVSTHHVIVYRGKVQYDVFDTDNAFRRVSTMIKDPRASFSHFKWMKPTCSYFGAIVRHSKTV